MDGRSHGIRCFHFQQSRRPLHAASNSWYFSASFVLSCGRFDGALFSSSIVRRGRCAAASTGVRCCCCCCACSGGRRLLTVVATRQVELRCRRRRRCPSFAHPVSPRRPRVTGSRAASVSALFHRSRFVLGLPAVLLRQSGHRVWKGKKCFVWGRQLATVGLTRTIKMAAPGSVCWGGGSIVALLAAKLRTRPEVGVRRGRVFESVKRGVNASPRPTQHSYFTPFIQK